VAVFEFAAMRKIYSETVTSERFGASFWMNQQQHLGIEQHNYYPASYFRLDAPIIGMVQILRPQLAVELCVAPNAVVRMTK
jgi:hypothetical protein